LEALLDQRAIFSAEEVDRRASLDKAKSVPPAFPPSLYAARINGLVIAEFVVDTAGEVEDGTIGIVSSTAAPFTDAVRDALKGSQYLPAMKAGHPVRQLVQQPFEFTVNRQGRQP
jgi:protein TonB